MVVQIDRRKCVWCGWCVNFCPRGAISSFYKLDIDPERCTDCYDGIHHFDVNEPAGSRQRALDRTQNPWRRLCVENCPFDAIVVKQQ